MPRPLFRKSGEELLQLFEQWKDSPADLQVLADELSRRTRPKSLALRKRVEIALQKLKSTQGIPVLPDQLLFADGKAEPQPKISTRDNETENRGRDRPSAGSDYFAPPEEFTLVEPLGVRGRPNAFKPVLENDVRLAADP